ncbi:helix-turn-helix transcriptional regulator [Microbulbifer sp. VAAF005]|uniref:helix-turn-helix domain-containing protein n=1 Tax=Microbulbifer sp. VAAF005 TaxID=3034230 RepID=UPI003340F69F
MPYSHNLSKLVGARIRARARTLNLTQSDVAAHLGVSRDFVARLYAGKKRGLSFSQLNTLCQALEIDADSLLGRSSPQKPLTDSEINDLLDEIGKLISAKINKS